jgi:hypothetical protein
MAEESYEHFIKDLLRDIKAVKKENQDWVYIIGGSEGAGKSLFTYMTINKLKETAGEDIDKIYYINDDIDYIEKIKNTAEYIYKDYLAKGKRYTKVNIFWYDEAAASLYNRMHATNTNIYTNLTLIQCRVVNGIHFFLQPNLFTVDPYVREWRNNVYIHIATIWGASKRLAFVFYKSNVIKKLIYKSQDFECAIKTNDISKLMDLCTYWFEIPVIKNEQEIVEYQKRKMEYFLQRIKKYYEKLIGKDES